MYLGRMQDPDRVDPYPTFVIRPSRINLIRIQDSKKTPDPDPTFDQPTGSCLKDKRMSVYFGFSQTEIKIIQIIPVRYLKVF